MSANAHGRAALVWLALFVASVSLADDTPLLVLAEQAGEPWCRHGCERDENAAHLAAGRHYLDAALRAQREVNWRVYRLADGTYTYSYPSVGEFRATQSRMPPFARDVEYVSAGHIHWDDVHEFSGQDWNWVAGNRRTLYLITRERTLRRATPRMARSASRTMGLSVRSDIRMAGQVIATLPSSDPSPPVVASAR